MLYLTVSTFTGAGSALPHPRTYGELTAVITGTVITLHASRKGLGLPKRRLSGDGSP